MISQASLENSITYRACQSFERGKMPWLWNLSEHSVDVTDYLTSADPTVLGPACALLAFRKTWVMTNLSPLAEPVYRSSLSVYEPDFSKPFAWNANQLAYEIHDVQRGANWGTSHAEARHGWRLHQWHKAFICWPKLYPTALKLYEAGLGGLLTS